MDGRTRTHTISLAGVMTGVAVLVLVLPYLHLPWVALSTPGARQALWEWLASPGAWLTMFWSVVLSGFMALLGLGLGLGLGMAYERFSFKFKGLALFLTLVPVAVPPYVTAVGWTRLLDPSSPLASVVPAGVLSHLDSMLFGAWGVALVHLVSFVPVTTALTMVGLRSVNPRLEQAARLHAGWGPILRRITLPLVLPVAGAGSVAVFLLSLGEVTVPAYFHHQVVASESFLRIAAFYDYPGAAATSLPMAVLGIGVVALARPLWKSTWIALVAPSVGRPVSLRASDAGPWGRALVFLGVAWPVVMVLPAMSMALLDGINMHVFIDTLRNSLDALLSTASWGLVGGALMASLGYVAAVALRQGSVAGAVALVVGLVMFSLPPSISALGAIPMGLESLGAFGVVLLLAGRYFVLPVLVAAHGFGAIPRSQEHAAALAGAGPFTRHARILLPLMRPHLAAMAALGYVLVARDTAMGMVLFPPGQDTLPVRTFTMLANGDPGMVSSLALFTVFMVLVPGILLALMGRRLGWRS